MIQVQALSSHLVPCIVRDYRPSDQADCAAVYASNAPHFYSEAALAECLAFVEEGTSYQLVVEHEGRVVGCGGLELRGEGPFAHLIFGCIHKEFQGKGFGTTLLATRLSLIEHEGQTIAVQLEAHGTVAPFYAKCGFVLASVRPNRHEPGQPSGNWALKIQPGEIDALRETLGAHGVEIQLTDPPEDEGSMEEDAA